MIRPRHASRSHALLSAALSLAALASRAAPAVASPRHHAHHRVDLRAYRANVARWHDATALEPASRTPDGRLVLRLWSVNTHARAELAPVTPAGGFDPAAQADFARVLGDPRTDSTHAIEPRLMDLLYTVASHFEAPQVTVISGYRAESGHSNHGNGHAVDFLIPGVPDARVAEFAQSLPDVGVGLYPVSGFVHLDARDYNTTWVDRSGPGQRSTARHHHHHHHGATAQR